MDNKRLYRSRTERMFFGVAGGLGHYFNIDPTLVRLIFIILTLAGGHGVLVYLILAIIMPEEPATYTTTEGVAPPPSPVEPDL